MTDRHDRLFRLYNELLRMGETVCYMGNQNVSEEQLEKWIAMRIPKSKQWAQEQWRIADDLYYERLDIIDQAARELDNV